MSVWVVTADKTMVNQPLGVEAVGNDWANCLSHDDALAVFDVKTPAQAEAIAAALVGLGVSQNEINGFRARSGLAVEES